LTQSKGSSGLARCEPHHRYASVPASLTSIWLA